MTIKTREIKELENVNSSEFREFVNENSRLVIPYEYPTVLEWNKEGEITNITVKERSDPNIESNLFKCVLCYESFQFFIEFLNHMKEDFSIFLSKKGDEK